MGLVWGKGNEGKPGIGFAVFNANVMGSGLVVSGWAVLRYCREMGISRDEAILGMQDIVATVQGMSDDWLQEHNKSVLVVPVFSLMPKNLEMLSVDWNLAWQQVKSEHFRYPVLRGEESRFTL